MQMGSRKREEIPLKRQGSGIRTPHQRTSVDETQGVRETVKRYQSPEYARRYRETYDKGLTPVHIRSRVIAAREVAVIRSLLQQINPEEGVVLDVPSGTGKLEGMLSEFPWQIIAADVSLAMMTLAREECRDDQLIRYLKCDARQLPLDDKSVDTIVCLRLFQRLGEAARRTILREFHRVGRRQPRGNGARR